MSIILVLFGYVLLGVKLRWASSAISRQVSFSSTGD